jgi:DNA-binding IclR family transcriptional regulator
MSEIPFTDGAQHPIRVAQRRIAEVFARGASLPRSENAPGLLSCVVPVAEAVLAGTPADCGSHAS